MSTKKQFSILIFVVLIINLSNGQDFDFGKVSLEELKEKYHPKDSSANAAILYRKEEISFSFSENVGFTQERDVHVRIKVYNKEGFEWANEKVFLYRGDGGVVENIKGIKGYTYSLEKGKIEEYKLKGNAIFDEEASELYNVTSFVLPNVKEGSVIEYMYTVTTPSPFLDDINLQFGIPMNKLDVKVSTPQFYSYNLFLNPKAIFTPNIVRGSKEKSISTTSRSRGEERGELGGSMITASYQTNKMTYKDMVISINEIDIPALKAEAFSGGINNYRAKLSMEMAAILGENMVVQRSFTSTWEKVSKSIYDSENFGGQLDKTNFFKNDLETIIGDIEDDYQKAFMVEQFVKSKVKWNGTFGKYAQRGIRNAYKEGEGNVADINLLLTAMLRSIGVKANPVLISTRNNGYPLFPTREGFNYVICMVQSGNSYLLIDATEPFSTNNVLPTRVLNWQGRVFGDDGTSSWVNLKTDNNSSESTMLNVMLNEDLSANGKVRQSITSYNAMSYRKKYTGVSSNDHIKALESNKGDIVISDLNYENGTNLAQPVRVSYNYNYSDAVDAIGENLYFNPMLFLRMKNSPFKVDKRNYPIDFVVPYQDKYLINIALPAGYKVESLPEPLAIEFKEGESKFIFLPKVSGKYLQLRVELDINNPLIDASDYKDFKNFFEKIVEKQSEQIVLTKA